MKRWRPRSLEPIYLIVYINGMKDVSEQKPRRKDPISLTKRTRPEISKEKIKIL